MSDVDALVARFEKVEQDLERGEDASAAETAQWLQWEALKASISRALSRDTASLLVDDAQVLCEDLWAREGAATPTNARSKQASERPGR